MVWPLIFHDFRHLAIKISCGLPRLRLLNQLEVKLIARDLLAPLFMRLTRGTRIYLEVWSVVFFLNLSCLLRVINVISLVWGHSIENRYIIINSFRIWLYAPLDLSVHYLFNRCKARNNRALMYRALLDIVFIFIYKRAMILGSRSVVENKFCIFWFLFLSLIRWDFYINGYSCFEKEADNHISHRCIQGKNRAVG